MYEAYAVGVMDALDHLGMHKQAQGGLLRQLAIPAATGGSLGAIGGAMAGGEGNRLQGALIGAGLGATGAALGHGLGGAMAAKGTVKVEESMGRDLARAMKSKSGEKLHGAAATGQKTKYMKSPSRQRFEGKLKDVTETGARTQRGTTMLGGVAGTGTGMSLTSNLEPPASTPIPQAMNPYGY